MNHVVARVSHQNLSDSFVHVRWYAVNCRTQVAIRERIQKPRWRRTELISYGRHTAFLSLDGGTSVVGDELTHDLTRTHERVHVRQCERWGPLFIPAYLLASLLIRLRGGRPYEDNPFEREAYGKA